MGLKLDRYTVYRMWRNPKQHNLNKKLEKMKKYFTGSSAPTSMDFIDLPWINSTKKQTLSMINKNFFESI